LYDVNDSVRGVPIFPDLVGQRPVPARMRPDWSLYFQVNGNAPQASKRVDTAYAGALQNLPPQLTGELEQPEHAALAYRDLKRGSALELPSGESVARAMGEKPLDRDALGLPAGMCPHGTPLSTDTETSSMWASMCTFAVWVRSSSMPAISPLM
jgi:hypothetical protein